MISAKLSKINLERAKRALIEAGYTIVTDHKEYIDFLKSGTGEKNRGTIYADGRIFTDQKDVFQKMYAAQTIKDASKRFGWRVANQITTKQGTIQIQLKR